MDAVTTPAAAVTLIEEVGAVARGDVDGLAALLDRYDSELLERWPHWASGAGAAIYDAPWLVAVRSECSP